jgi:hypothetical protein
LLSASAERLAKKPGASRVFLWIKIVLSTVINRLLRLFQHLQNPLTTNPAKSGKLSSNFLPKWLGLFIFCLFPERK